MIELLHLGRLRSIITIQTFTTMAAAIVATWLCRKWDLYGEFPLTLVGTAVIFPIVFSISGAYKRREHALGDYAAIKGHGRALYFATRDWIEDGDEEIQAEVRGLLTELMDAMRGMFLTPVKEMREHERRVYGAFSDLSLFVKKLRTRGLPSGEASRCNQFVSKMMISFESVKHIYQYRTPTTLRVYSKFFIYTLPIAYGPYFAAIGRDYSDGLQYVMPVLLSGVLVSLDNIQEHLENPFDQVGDDDVVINVEKFAAMLDEV